MAEGPRGREERVDPLEKEDWRPREERDPLGREDHPLGTEDPAPLPKEDPLLREERRSDVKNKEEESLLDKAKRKLEGL